MSLGHCCRCSWMPARRLKKMNLPSDWRGSRRCWLSRSRNIRSSWISSCREKPRNWSRRSQSDKLSSIKRFVLFPHFSVKSFWLAINNGSVSKTDERYYKSGVGRDTVLVFLSVWDADMFCLFVVSIVIVSRFTGKAKYCTVFYGWMSSVCCWIVLLTEDHLLLSLHC